MRYFVALMVLLALAAGAQATEPFGTSYRPKLDTWAADLQVRFVGKDKPIIDEIVAQVRQKPKEYRLAWVNQLVNLRVDLVNIDRTGTCGPLAVAKYQVLQSLGYAKEDLRLVVGEEVSGANKHAVLAVHTVDGWRVLDNGTLFPRYGTVPDAQIKKIFHAFYAFN